MKLLMLNNFFPSHFGGIEVVASNLAAEISRCGVEVTWIATDTTPPPTDDEASCRVVAVSSNNFLEHRTGIPWPIPTISAVRRIWHEIGRTDVVLVHDVLYPISLVAFSIAK